MGPSRWLVNASPLIFLGKTQQLDLLAALAAVVVVPQPGACEVDAKPDGAAVLAELTGNPAFHLVDFESPPPEVLAWDLGPGETQVITHALRHGADRVLLDALEARRCAKAMGLRVIGTLGVVGRAKSAGRIAAVRPIIEHLRRTRILPQMNWWGTSWNRLASKMRAEARTVSRVYSQITRIFGRKPGNPD